MKELYIGELLRKRRLELGLTQEQVCEGIFNEPSTLSRIENGKQIPPHGKLTRLLQRLGLPEDRYYAFIDKNELEMSELQAQIISCQVRNKFVEGLTKLDQYEKIISPNDFLAQQFLLSARAIMGKVENGELVAYPFEEQLNMLFHALQMTVPHFDIDHISQGLYCIDEIKIINQIALVYSNANQRNLAIKIYAQLFNYVESHLCEPNQTPPIMVLIAYNYALNLCQEKHLNKALEIAELGRRISLEIGRSSYLGGLLYIIADCLHHLHRDEESQKYFREAYYMYSIMEDTKHVNLTQETIEEFFGAKFNY